MKIALLRVPDRGSITADMSDIFDRDLGIHPPLGLLFLSASLKKLRPGDQVRVIDCRVLNADLPETIRLLTDFQPDIIGLTTLTFQLVEVYRFAAQLKEKMPACRLVLGGPHVHLFPEETLLNPDIDYVVTGEGEFSFPQLVSALAEKREPSGIPGLFYRDAERKIRSDRPPETIKNLDDVPAPDLQAVPIRNYLSGLTGRPAGLLMTSRGCPYRCIYCDRPHLGNVFRAHSPQRVISDLKDYLNSGVSEFHFFDDTFTVQRSRVLEICRLIRQEKLDISFSARARVNTVDEQLLRAMKPAGCRMLSFGVEAGNNRSLDALRKGVTVEQAENAFRLCRKLRISTLADFILGGPGQTAADLEETIAFSLKLDPDYVQFTVMTPYPGTELYRLGLEQGIIKTDYWREFAKKPSPDFQTPVWEENLSRPELVEFFHQAYRRFYRRPKIVFRELFKIRSGRELFRKAAVGLSVLNTRRKE